MVINGRDGGGGADVVFAVMVGNVGGSGGADGAFAVTEGNDADDDEVAAADTDVSVWSGGGVVIGAIDGLKVAAGLGANGIDALTADVLTADVVTVDVVTGDVETADVVVCVVLFGVMNSR